MVRLIEDGAADRRIRNPKFQFLNGSINRETGRASGERFRKFQFLNGSINSESVAWGDITGDIFQFLNGSINSSSTPTRMIPTSISIPKWFD